MKCNKCLHYEVCVKLGKPSLYGINQEIGCSAYKDKTKILEGEGLMRTPFIRIIEILKEKKEKEENTEAVFAYEIAIAAIKKQIPQKPLSETRFFGHGKCPNCMAVFMDKSTNACGNCGQALDWGNHGEE